MTSSSFSISTSALKTYFQKFDANGDGKINTSEMQRAASNSNDVSSSEFKARFVAQQLKSQLGSDGYFELNGNALERLSGWDRSTGSVSLKDLARHAYIADLYRSSTPPTYDASKPNGELDHLSDAQAAQLDKYLDETKDDWASYKEEETEDSNDSNDSGSDSGNFMEKLLPLLLLLMFSGSSTTPAPAATTDPFAALGGTDLFSGLF